MLGPLRHSEYRRLVGALAVSVVGAGMWTVVMPMQVLDMRDDARALSVVATCLSTAAVVAALIGGVAADRLPQRRIIIGVQTLNFVCLLAIAPLAVLDRLQLWELALAATVVGMGGGLFAPAFTAYLPTLVPERELMAANGIEGVMRSTLQQAVGPTLAGVLLGAAYPDTGLVIITALYVVSLALLITLRPSRPAPAVASRRGWPWSDVRDGFRVVVRTRWLRWTLAANAVSTFAVAGPVEVLLPYLTQEHFSDGPLAFGAIVAAVGAGSTIGAIAVSSRGLPRRYFSALVLGGAVAMMPLAVLGNVSIFLVMAGSAAVVGVGQGISVVIRATLLQRRVPRESLGRVASADVLATLALLPVSTAVTGALSEVVPMGVIFGVAACLPILAASVAMVAGRLRRDELEHDLR
ncbi:tetracycline efflux MFS transporter Tet(V) [Mycolicibacterium madagascariense]|uniref:Tetracycline efflux MFS transporter Tet(V) n=1 Tax=Mycolicibacterium madagascariense TaxID=212765 RepID=A0A7I7XCS3_9MYCO|nr:MFS transporter [Mycolicibacterium madagascariense]MCV7015266.1 MFS transporter [Mycolicibacterium madagascariense]BBZ27559.1 tetracycline efflux MFS transporter Tet(V) [Mycolicibacterium madagascariense]